ncbi:hypothetical protein AK812_SmicGene42957 [Symbiodinium microadriaticum]|uniref:Uncharacterized protein n=1 Tax=Symbiodinium microadriaticum TaxID=2951 RepID=A0A1Q9C291_SYMMI|nr:hypothetical protein AK812_SmicGene42957 [Symbiodinium microadriaticum]
MSLARRVLGEKSLRLRPKQLCPAVVEEVLSGVRGSQYFGRNRGSHDFYRNTLGFSLAFRSSHRTRVEA